MLNKLNQFLRIVEAVIVPVNSLPMVNNPAFFVFRKAVQKPFHAVSLKKQGKPIGLYFA